MKSIILLLMWKLITIKGVWRKSHLFTKGLLGNPGNFMDTKFPTLIRKINNKEKHKPFNKMK